MDEAPLVLLKEREYQSLPIQKIGSSFFLLIGRLSWSLQEGAKPAEDFYEVQLVRQSGQGPADAQRFLIGQSLGGGQIAKRAAEASAAFGVAVQPFAGVAAPLSSSSAGKQALGQQISI